LATGRGKRYRPNKIIVHILVLCLRESDIINGCIKFRYLGAICTKDGKDTKNTGHRVTQAQKIIGELNGVWWSQGVTKTREKMICNRVVKSVLM